MMRYIIHNKKFEEGYCVICSVVCNNNCTKVCPVNCIYNGNQDEPSEEQPVGIWQNGGSWMRYIIKGSRKVTMGLCYCSNCDNCKEQCGTQCMRYSQTETPVYMEGLYEVYN